MILQEFRLHAGGTGRSGERVVDQEIERRGAVLMAGVADLRDQFGDKIAIVDRLRLQPLKLARLDFVQIAFVQRHVIPHFVFPQNHLASGRSGRDPRCVDASARMSVPRLSGRIALPGHAA